MTEEEYKESAESFYSSYEHYGNSLRLWLVSYGIGAPVLFISNKDLYATVSKIDAINCIVFLFLLASFAQIINALINKWCNWYNYAFEARLRKKDGKTYKIVCAICNASWYDWVTDLVSVLLLCWATLWLFLSIT